MQNSKLIYRTISIILAVLLLVVSYVCFQKYNNEQKERKTFLNNVQSHIGDIYKYLQAIQDYTDKDNYKKLETSFSNLNIQLYLLHELLEDGTLYVDKKINYIAVNYGFDYIAYAFEGRLVNKGYQGSFLADRKISDTERKFINSLAADIKLLYNNINKKGKKNIKNFSENLKLFLDKWGLNAEINSSNTSYYDYLLVK